MPETVKTPPPVKAADAEKPDATGPLSVDPAHTGLRRSTRDFLKLNALAHRHR